MHTKTHSDNTAVCQLRVTVTLILFPAATSIRLTDARRRIWYSVVEKGGRYDGDCRHSMGRHDGDCRHSTRRYGGKCRPIGFPIHLVPRHESGDKCKDQK